MNKTILVTGASGFVGSHIVCGLADCGYKVIALGGTKNCPEVVRSRSFASSNADLTDAPACHTLIESYRPQIVVHAAALASVNVCEEYPELAEKQNVLATECLAGACRRIGCELFVQISTDLVFDGASAPLGGFRESDNPTPQSVYARTKAAAEQRAFQSEMHAIVLRISLIYGEKIENLEGFMGWLRGGLERGEERTLFTDEFRTPVYAGDIAKALHALAQLSNSERTAKLSDRNGHRILHLGGSERISRLELGLLVAEVFALPKKLISPSTRDAVPSRVPRPADVSLCIAKIQSSLGVIPVSLRQGLEHLKARSVYVGDRTAD